MNKNCNNLSYYSQYYIIMYTVIQRETDVTSVFIFEIHFLDIPYISCDYVFIKTILDITVGLSLRISLLSNTMSMKH